MINSICTQCTLSPPGAAWLSWVGEPSTFSSAPGSYSPKHTVCFSCTPSCRPIVQCQIVRNEELGISERRELQQKKCFVALMECKVLLVSPSVPGHPWALESSRVSPGKLLSEDGSVSCRASQNIFIKSCFLSKIPVVYAELELGIIGSHYSSGTSAHFYPSVKLNLSFIGKTLTWCHSIQTLTFIL